MNRRVLFVEDEALLRTIYQLQAQTQFEVEVVESAAAALAALARTEFAVVVTDMSMPEMDGLTLAAMIRQQAPHTVLLLLTAHAVLPSAETGLLFRVLTKPCPRSELLQSLEAAAALYESQSSAVATVTTGAES